MFGVTVHATQIWIGVIHLAVCLGDLGHLRCHFGMAVRTAVSHVIRRPGCNVTCFAIAHRGRVRRYTADFRVSLCVECAWGEHAIPARHRNSHDHRQCEKRGDDRTQGKTSKTIAFHSASVLINDAVPFCGTATSCRSGE